MSQWIMLIPSIVFSRIKEDFDESLKTEYNMTGANFSATDATNKKAVFPFVFVKTISSAEEGATLEGEDINAGTFSFQVDVMDNVSQYRARKVMGEVLRIAKSMGFQIVSMPEFEYSDTHRSIARIRRIIGASDTL